MPQKGTPESARAAAAAPADPRHALVMGGGGILGIAWEVGVLAALGEAGLDVFARPADIVSTSAGSIVAACVLSGHALADLEAQQHTPPVEQGAGGSPLDLEALRELGRLWLLGPSMDRERARACGELALAAKTRSEAAWVESISAPLGTAAWPDARLRPTTVSCSSGERVAWTAADGVDLRLAVAASCSVPGMFPPVRVDPARDERYTDGGLWSGSNADLAAQPEVEHALIIEPLSAGDTAIARFSRRALERELAAMHAAGIATQVVSPGADYAELTRDLMNTSLRPEAAAAGRRDGAAAAERVAEFVRA